MKISHIAIWTEDLERLKEFYLTYFNATAGNIYINSSKQFSSYFLHFEDDCNLEIMHKQGVKGDKESKDKPTAGYAHIAFSLGSNAKVDELTERLRENGYKIIGEPRVTGDGYYESVIADPDGNLIEITV